MGAKTVGSITFGTNVMNTEEYILMAKVISENEPNAEKIADQITLIDDLLTINRASGLMLFNRFTKTGRRRKNTTVNELIEKRISMFLDEQKKSNESNAGSHSDGNDGRVPEEV